MRKSFWTDENELSADSNRIFDKFVPDIGPTAYHETECFRASNRIVHDFYNNGMGNNCTGAWNWLANHTVLLAKFDPEISQHLGDIKWCMNCTLSDSEDTEQAITAIHEAVIKMINGTKASEWTLLEVDPSDNEKYGLFSLQEPNRNDYDEEDDDYPEYDYLTEDDGEE